MVRTYSRALLSGLVVACAVPQPSSVVFERELRSQAWIEGQDSTGRCDYGWEGALGLAAATAGLGIVNDRPTDQLAYMIPISAGVGWLWGRFMMPQRSRCRLPHKDPESADTAASAQRSKCGGA